MKKGLSDFLENPFFVWELSLLLNIIRTFATLPVCVEVRQNEDLQTNRTGPELTTKHKDMKKLFLLCIVCWIHGLYAAGNPAIYDSMQVIHNELHLDLLNFKKATLRGKADITVRSKREHLAYAPFLLLHMQIDSIQVNGRPVTTYQYNDTLLRIPLDDGLKRDEVARLSIAYHGRPVGRVFGGMLFSDSLQMAYTMGASLDDVPHSFGRAWFPAVDDFRSRSLFDLYIRTEQGKKAIASGLLRDTVPHKDGTTTWHWRVNQPIPDYLVALAIAPYEKIHYDYRQAGRTLPIDIYVLPDEVEAARETYAIVPKVLEILERYLGEYRFDRVGYVSVNSPGGAMEHVANISMPMHPQPDPAFQSIVIHELIHSWFGNRVTCATAQDMWLNEGLTTWLVEVVMEEVFSSEIAEDYRRSNQMIGAVLAPKFDKGYYALSRMPDAFTYSPTVYYKGAMVMHTLRRYLGDEVLFPALKKYLERYSFRSVTIPEFKAFLSAETGVDLKDCFELWIDQPGAPAFEIDSIRGTFTPAVVSASESGKEDRMTSVSGRYKGAVYIEQKGCPAFRPGRNVRLPVCFYDASGRQKQILDVSVTGSHTAVSFELPFEPAYGVVDTACDICKSSTLERLRIDTVRTYSAPACMASIHCEAVSDPADLYMEFYGVAPDPVKNGSSWQLSDTHYWRLSGVLPATCRLTGDFALDRDFWDATLLSGKPKEIIVLYRGEAADDWREIRTVPFTDHVHRITVEHLMTGEYCLAVRK